MGTLRFLLAIGVAAEHSGFYVGAGSYTAVQAFFILSGFYMALLLTSGRYASYRSFIASRFLRIFPVYWACVAGGLILFALVYCWAGKSVPLFQVAVETGQDATKALWLLIGNMLIFTSHLAWFLPLTIGSVEHPVHLLVVPPVWSLDIELMFYIACPFIVRWSNRTIIGVTILLLAIRAIGYVGGLNSPPWHARFPPFEFMFFLLGILVFKLSESIKLGIKNGLHLVLVWLLFFLWGFFYTIAGAVELPRIYGLNDALVSITFYALICISVPFLFDRTSSNKLDAYLGELAYPTFIVHYILVTSFIHTKLLGGISGSLFVIVSSIGMAAILHRYIQVPVDRYRHARFVASVDMMKRTGVHPPALIEKTI